MAIDDASLPANVLEALQRRETIEAIRRLRDATGLGLEQCMDVIDGHQRGRTGRYRGAASEPFPADVVAALARGDKIAAIKRLRVHRGIGLKEAKDAVDARYRQPGQAIPPRSAANPRRLIDVIWWMAGLALIGYAIHFFTGNPG